MDDWAWERGQRYGTVLVDLERHTVVDLLPGREADSFAARLRAHPGVEVIARDQGAGYADAVAAGRPMPSMSQTGGIYWKTVALPSLKQ